jgi:hypothetical protein
MDLAVAFIGIFFILTQVYYVYYTYFKVNRDTDNVDLLKRYMNRRGR